MFGRYQMLLGSCLTEAEDGTNTLNLLGDPVAILFHTQTEIRVTYPVMSTAHKKVRGLSNWLITAAHGALHLKALQLSQRNVNR